jgi:hypothetical protein
MKSIRLIGVVIVTSWCLDLAHAPRAAAATSEEAATHATPSAAFGAAGSVVLVGSTLLVSRTAKESLTEIFAGQLAVNFFPVSGLSVGIAGAETWVGSDQASGISESATYQLEARAGIQRPLSPWASFWPQLGIGFSRSINTVTDSSRVVIPGEPPETQLVFDLDLPVLVHPSRWFFLGFGPELQASFSDATNSLRVAGHFVFGGAFGTAKG